MMIVNEQQQYYINNSSYCCMLMRPSLYDFYRKSNGVSDADIHIENVERLIRYLNRDSTLRKAIKIGSNRTNATSIMISEETFNYIKDKIPTKFLQ